VKKHARSPWRRFRASNQRERGAGLFTGLISRRNLALGRNRGAQPRHRDHCGGLSTPRWRGCRLRYAPFRSMAVRSSTPPSKPGVSAAAFTCSYCRRARPSSTSRSSAQRTHTEEFYELRPFESFTVEGLNHEARSLERINTVRPHQALGYLTPLEFLRGSRREANASRLNHPLRASAPASRVATGDERSEPALDAGAPARHKPPFPKCYPCSERVHSLA
jgi:hypothetical protein